MLVNNVKFMFHDNVNRIRIRPTIACTVDSYMLVGNNNRGIKATCIFSVFVDV